MKKTAVLNAQLSGVIASLGHTDGLTICDAGLPIPSEQQCVDLALTKGIPSFLSTLEVVLTELFVERILLAEEIKQVNPTIEQQLLEMINKLAQTQGRQIEIEYVVHSEFKQRSNQAKAVVRTGECSPYANVILYSGVPF
ncbi:D-ribose pyranase [Actinobacillus pleuropneumoniae]|uniref:D-ribose pyranase n=1 Tax=Actinobacillus pleuropneumoniae serovar 6 str. Femo TaxID=754256 RepID=A0A828Q4C9_ACTPL|nr:D-ribose pyranase [Actinobacillus pleuropneumoniae]EFL81127.1 D-ribose pyranase [Actinobacillus pleuropneumoniae serovar 6 str. Femo]EFM91239.1 D-ribose pyranase [Actinobacillus pleuropneumoniae serovar 6 str. Femo]UKH12164.1 D-ribose pyranase [Actinobacillus pleuropneumoniae serovar 6 str. Femo]SUU54086.1 D-ribose pyranase [Actinobacillus pleuropneumoniae]